MGQVSPRTRWTGLFKQFLDTAIRKEVGLGCPSKWIHGLGIFFDTKGISHADDKILVAGGLMKTTALLSFYANEGKKVSRKSWGEFKTQIFDIALPVCWRTTLKTSICQLKMLPTKSFVQFSTRGLTLQSMVNFDTTTSLPNNALAEYIVIGLPTHLRGKANEWELLEADPFDYPHFEKRLTLFNQIIKEQSSNQPSRTAPLSQPTNCSPDEVDAFLDLQGWCHFCKKNCGSLRGRCPNQMDKKWVDIPTSFVTPPKPADYKQPRAHDPPPN
ncbi:hypothetical protein PSTG_01294 [Puccinia striiformis f. sp. tritici PST-78]|uniref:Uncharacterized protein n=1 Tax=Puccinia striiformis f. sp. tritici PST-78 TaxID=1165861 RepID=A0A0L0W1S9_9BASI|nr:hypothetical protein PSTG_01294 [Puccinia striiformis f. sp. tritici PST-78]